MQVRHLVVGHLGEVGSALRTILNADGVDLHVSAAVLARSYDMLHVAIPYFGNGEGSFVDAVKEYADTYLKPSGLIVVHSTVPVGTTRQIGPNAVHSPIRGIHPNLVEGIKTFTKFFGGPRAMEAAMPFLDRGIKFLTVDDPETTEAAKLFCTTAYGISVAIEKAIHEYCQAHQLDFRAVYTFWTESYNEGFRELGMGHVARPVLKHMEGPIGGHCIIPNAGMLDSHIARFLIECNDRLTTVSDSQTTKDHMVQGDQG